MRKLKFSGYMTIEGLIIFPIIMCMMLLFILLIRIYASSTQITHAALRTADHLAVSGEDGDHLISFQKYFKQINGNVAARITSKAEFAAYENKVILSTEAMIPTCIPFISFSEAKLQRQSVSLLWYVDEPQESVWHLTAFERGKVIQKHFGGNLPEFFPTIDVWEPSGTVTLIVSIDITSNSYQSQSALQKLLDSNLSKLETFNGANYGGVEILFEQIHNKKIVIVIPEDCATEEQRNLLNHFIEKCGQAGIDTRVIEYQKK